MQQEHVEALKRKTATVMHIAEAQKKAWFEVWRRVQAQKQIVGLRVIGRDYDGDTETLYRKMDQRRHC